MENRLPIGDLECYQELDLAIDGADEVDEELNCIKVKKSNFITFFKDE